MENDFIVRKYTALCSLLKSELNPEGYWTGRLSTSALSTAVAIVALKKVNDLGDANRAETGIEWLLNNINDDGGFGDTPESVSNVSTTLLCYAAISCYKISAGREAVIRRMEEWLRGKGITMEPKSITGSVLGHYGRDYTFSVPILSMLHLAGVITSSSLKEIPGLPFELTLLPRSLYRFFNLRVVSYALPALIGVGIYLHIMCRNKFNLYRRLRNLFIKPSIRKLDMINPESGGFLEAVPLTAFVVMCLVASGESDNDTVIKGSGFLRKLQREDGGWPIDTDLSTWVTTLAVKALGSDIKKQLGDERIDKLREHLLRLQYREIHPFNGAEPGGWGWTCYSGSVPDADDTPGAILALLELYRGSDAENKAILDGCKWLVRLQNSDGGFPTFCRGWGRLPFDKSCADLTGHALLALIKTMSLDGSRADKKIMLEIERSVRKATGYLATHQGPDGSFLPLWFGNQKTDDQTNPAYGTAKVCTYLLDCLTILKTGNDMSSPLEQMIEKAQVYLVSQQNDDGSWGGKKGIEGTIEETSLAICALAAKNREACIKGLGWLEKHETMKASPIGLYFALLWYDEKLYPAIYYTEALRRLCIDCNIISS